LVSVILAAGIALAAQVPASALALNAPLSAATQPEEQQASQMAEKPSGIMALLKNLRFEEDAVRDAEREVQSELDAEPPSALSLLFDRARLLNLKAILFDEEVTIKDEEEDLEKQDTAKFKKDVERLEGLETIEAKLQFSGEENKELNFLQRLLSK